MPQDSAVGFPMLSKLFTLSEMQATYQSEFLGNETWDVLDLALDH